MCFSVGTNIGIARVWGALAQQQVRGLARSEGLTSKFTWLQLGVLFCGRA